MRNTSRKSIDRIASHHKGIEQTAAQEEGREMTPKRIGRQTTGLAHSAHGGKLIEVGWTSHNCLVDMGQVSRGQERLDTPSQAAIQEDRNRPQRPTGGGQRGQAARGQERPTILLHMVVERRSVSLVR